MTRREILDNQLDHTPTEEEEQTLKNVARILKGIKGGGFTRVFPTLPYKGVKVLNIDDIMNKIYLEQLEP